jgi:subtilisin family serine protease
MRRFFPHGDRAMIFQPRERSTWRLGTPSSSQRRVRARLTIEVLEDRTLLSTVSNIPVLVSGTYAPDHILVGDFSGQVRKVPLTAGTSIQTELAAYQNAPGVAYAEPDYYVHLTSLPNDPYFGQQWGLQNTGQPLIDPSFGLMGTAGADINAPAAWDITTGSAKIVVGEIDSGIDSTNPDLAPNIATNLGWNFVNNTSNTMDDFYDNAGGTDYYGHGTEVAGVIGAVGNNHIGVAGVNWNVQIAPMKVVDANGNGITLPKLSTGVSPRRYRS